MDRGQLWFGFLLGVSFVVAFFHIFRAFFHLCLGLSSSGADFSASSGKRKSQKHKQNYHSYKHEYLPYYIIPTSSRTQNETLAIMRPARISSRAE